jgi:hypothetical protein
MLAAKSPGRSMLRSGCTPHWCIRYFEERGDEKTAHEWLEMTLFGIANHDYAIALFGVTRLSYGQIPHSRNALEAFLAGKPNCAESLCIKGNPTPPTVRKFS